MQLFHSKFLLTFKNALQEGSFWNHLHPDSIIPWSTSYSSSVNCFQIFLLKLLSWSKLLFISILGCLIQFSFVRNSIVYDNVLPSQNFLCDHYYYSVFSGQMYRSKLGQEDFTILSVLSKWYRWNANWVTLSFIVLTISARNWVIRWIEHRMWVLSRGQNTGVKSVFRGGRSHDLAFLVLSFYRHWANQIIVSSNCELR